MQRRLLNPIIMASLISAASLPTLSPLSTFIESSSAKLPISALPLEVLHNLRYQHGWTDLLLHPTSSSYLDPSTPSNLDIHSSDEDQENLTPNSLPPPLHLTPVPLLSGLPPRPIYTHPDHQAHLLAHDFLDTLTPQREWVLPVSIAEKWTLRRFCAVFDSLPERAPLQGAAGTGYEHQDAKRVLLAMVGHQGKGGDGTVVYYIMQEGEVKPRQN